MVPHSQPQKVPRGAFTHEAKTNLTIFIRNENAEIYLDHDIIADGIVTSEVLVCSPYFLKKDTLIIKNDCFKFEFLVVNDELLISLNNLKGYIKKGDKFYCSQKVDNNGNIKYIGRWKDGKKDGIWLYFDKKGEITGIKYDEGQIIDTPRVVVDDTNYKKYLEVNPDTVNLK